MNRQDYPVGRGETFTISGVITAPGGAPVNLTGHTVTFRHNAANTGSLIASYPATVDASGNFSLAVPSATTLTWPGTSAYVLAWVQPSGVETWLSYGRIKAVTSD